MNLDRVADLVKSLAPRVEVRGIADSGWFLDIPQFNEKTCTEPLSCSPTTGIKKGFEYVLMLLITNLSNLTESYHASNINVTLEYTRQIAEPSFQGHCQRVSVQEHGKQKVKNIH